MINEHPSKEQEFIREIMSLPFVCQNYLLAPHTYYHIGGYANFAMLPNNKEEVEHAYKYFQLASIPKFILGGGTNVLISDKGFRGLILITSHYNEVQTLENDRYYITSGVELQWVVKEILLKNNYDGVGALTGIPGTVGGAIFMNAGTTNGSICDFLEEVHLITPLGEKRVKVGSELYGYRFQSFCSPNDLILGGVFQFKKSDKDQESVYQHYLKRREEKQPQGYCCGSVFKNPIGLHAGKLIEDCGLKGYRYGGAVISPVHANFIMNEHKASFDDILWLIQLAKNKVREKFGVLLEEEVRILYEDGCVQYCPHYNIKS